MDQEREAKRRELEAQQDGILRAVKGNSGTELPAVQGALLQMVIQDHADVLTKAAEASDRYASRLAAATWALVLATVGLIVVEWFKR
jgi:hypothetical protein